MPDLSSSKTYVKSVLAGTAIPILHSSNAHIEDIVCKLAGITKGEELLVDLDKLRFAETAGRAACAGSTAT